jgi:hypothetical protein
MGGDPTGAERVGIVQGVHCVGVNRTENQRFIEKTARDRESPTTSNHSTLQAPTFVLRGFLSVSSTLKAAQPARLLPF